MDSAITRLTQGLDDCLQNDSLSAIATIQSSFKNLLKLKQVRDCLREDAGRKAIASVSSTIDRFQKSTIEFEDAKNAIQSKELLEQISFIQTVLPRDPNLKCKPQMLVRGIASAILIHFFPDQLLLKSDDSPDDSEESYTCQQASNLLMYKLKAFLKFVQSDIRGLRRFRDMLVGYRYCVRNFFEAFDTWKRVCAERMVLAMQQPYMFCYGTLKSAINSSNSNADNDAEIGSVISMSTRQLDRLKTTMSKLVGQSKAIELQNLWQTEIDAQLSLDLSVIQSDGNVVSPVVSPTSNVSSSHPEINSSPSSAERNASLRNEQMIASLAAMAGIDNDRLVHEICVNPSYRLPSVSLDPYSVSPKWHISRLPNSAYFTNHAIEAQSLGSLKIKVASSSSADVGPFSEMPEGTPRAGRITQNPTELSEQPLEGNQTDSIPSKSDKPSTENLLKRVFLDILGDQLICSLVRSPVVSVNEIRVGDVIPILFGSNDNCKAASADGLFRIPAHKYDAMTAKVTKLYYDEVGVSNTNESIGTEAAQSPIAGDVIYLADGGVEHSVDFRSRVILSEDPPIARNLCAALRDTCDRLASTLKNRPEIAAQLAKAIELEELLPQMLSRRNVMTKSDLLDRTLFPIISVLQELQAIDKSEMTKIWWNKFVDTANLLEANEYLTEFETCIYILPSFFEFVSACIDDLRREIANFYVSQMAIALRSSGPSYLGQKFLSRRISQANDNNSLETILPNTTLFLQTAFRNVNVDTNETGELISIKELNEHSSSRFVPFNRNQIGVVQDTDVAIVAYAFVELLQVPYRLDTSVAHPRLPETFEWDGKRLAAIRDDIDILSIVSAVIVTVKQFQVKYGLTLSSAKGLSAVELGSLSSLSEWFEALFHRLDALLREPSISMAHIVSESVRFFAQLVASAADNGGISPQLPGNWEEELSRALVRVVAADGNHPVLTLFFRRICRVLLSGLVGGDFVSKLPGYSLASPAQKRSLQEIIARAKVVFGLSISAHGPIYSQLLRQLAASSAEAL